MISSASNGPCGCLWYDGRSTELPVKDITSLESCDMQLSNSIHYILVTLVYRSKQPLCWSLEREIDHLVDCDMMSVPLSFQLRILYHREAAICRIPTEYIIYLWYQYISWSSPAGDSWCIKWTIQLFVIWWVVHWAFFEVFYITGKLR